MKPFPSFYNNNINTSMIKCEGCFSYNEECQGCKEINNEYHNTHNAHSNSGRSFLLTTTSDHNNSNSNASSKETGDHKDKQPVCGGESASEQEHTATAPKKPRKVAVAEEILLSPSELVDLTTDSSSKREKSLCSGAVDLSIPRDVRREMRKNERSNRKKDKVHFVDLHGSSNYDDYFESCFATKLCLNSKGPLANLHFSFTAHIGKDESSGGDTGNRKVGK